MMAGVTQTLKTMSRNRWTSLPPTGTLPVPALATLLLVGAFFLVALPAHSQNEIVRNPEAVLLRKIWMVQGSPGDRVGAILGSLGDINGDSVGDFIWGVGSTSMWHVQHGGEQIGDTPVQSLYVKTTTTYPIVGDFWGTGEKQVGFASYYTDSNLRFYMYLLIYGIAGDTIRTEPITIGDPARGVWPGISGTPEQYFAIDIDRDGDDEVVIVQNVVRRNDGIRDARAEVWIYEGGPTFQLDTPTVVLKDTEENYNTYYAAVGDLDGDSIPDILSSAQYTRTDSGKYPVKYKFWWGKNALQDLSTNPDRTLTLDGAESNANAKLTLIDCDGDSVKDILRLLYAEPLGIHLYRSAAGKNIRDRSLTIEDADGYFPGYSIFGNGGYINDSLRRFESIILLGSRMLFFSGGKNGPNYTYDGYYSAADDGLKSENVFSVGAVIENCTGKGWDCYLTGNARWGDNDEGIVILLEGGSYIPTDDTTSGVEVVASNDHAEAFHTWPNPVLDELHIAWRGDLKRSPSLMVVYDINGREITSGAVEAWRGEAIWRCGSVSAGMYLLAIYDKEGELLATTRVVKQ